MSDQSATTEDMVARIQHLHRELEAANKIIRRQSERFSLDAIWIKLDTIDAVESRVCNLEDQRLPRSEVESIVKQSLSAIVSRVANLEDQRLTESIKQYINEKVGELGDNDIDEKVSNAVDDAVEDIENRLESIEVQDIGRRVSSLEECGVQDVIATLVRKLSAQ